MKVRKAKPWECFWVVRRYRDIAVGTSLLGRAVEVSIMLSCFPLYTKVMMRLLPMMAFHIRIVEDKTKVGMCYVKGAYYNDRAQMGAVVDEDSRGRGVGSLLVEEIIAIAKEMKVERVLAPMFTDNESARRLYDKYGFKTIIEIKGLDLWEK